MATRGGAKKHDRAQDVSYCRHSRLTEAWAVILGRPSTPDTQEVNAIVHQGRKLLKDGTIVPSIVLIESAQEGTTPPFWQTQVSWDGGVHLARIGHRYLSVHFLSRGGRRYETFPASLQRELGLWTDIYARTVAKGPGYEVNRIAFGYTNTFEFDADHPFRLGVICPHPMVLDEARPDLGLERGRVERPDTDAQVPDRRPG